MVNKISLYSVCIHKGGTVYTELHYSSYHLSAYTKATNFVVKWFCKRVFLAQLFTFLLQRSFKLENPDSNFHLSYTQEDGNIIRARGKIQSLNPSKIISPFQQHIKKETKHEEEFNNRQSVFSITPLFSVPLFIGLVCQFCKC